VKNAASHLFEGGPISARSSALPTRAGNRFVASGGNNKAARVLFPWSPGSTVNLREDGPKDNDVSASDLPSSATELFSRTLEPRPRNSVGGEKEGAPTRETPDSVDSGANKVNTGAAGLQENLLTTEPVSAKQHTADLTGIFHKVPSEQLEDVTPASAQGSEREDPGIRPASSGRAEEVVEMPAGFTQIFQSLSRSSDRRSGEDEKESYPAEPMPHDLWEQQSSEVRSSLASPGFQQTRMPSEGEFTRLFRNLKPEGSRTAVNEQSLSWNGAAAASQKGGFTQLLRTLSAEEPEGAPPAEDHSVASPYAAGEPASSGPGEFTRIVSGSFLREAQGRTMPAAPPRIPTVSPAAEISAPSPATLPAISPGALTPGPVFAPILTPEQLVAPQPAVPAAPVLPAAPPANSGNQIQPPSGNPQRYVPLLLIANLFVMVLLLIAVVVVILHR
jgi:hypothetical protein